MAIRPLAQSELERLDAAHPEPGRPESRHSERWGLQKRGEGTYLVRWSGGHPVGWVFALRPGSQQASAHAKHFAASEIVDLFVAPAFRGRGYGSSLLEAAEQVAQDAGWASIGLEVTVSNPHNDVARGMYERRGYRDSGRGEFESGYFYWTEFGEQRWEGEPHRFLIKSLRVAGSSRGNRARSEEGVGMEPNGSEDLTVVRGLSPDHRPSWSDVTSAGIFRVEPGGRFDRHYHDCDEYWLLYGGRARISVGDRTYEVRAGDIVCTPTGAEHDILAVEGTLEGFWFEADTPQGGRVGHLHRTEDDARGHEVASLSELSPA